MKQTLRTRLGYVEREYAKPTLLTIGVGAVMVAETVMGWQGLSQVMGNWAITVSFAIAVLQVLSSHTWGHRMAHNANRQQRLTKAGKERSDSEPFHDPALPCAMSVAAGIVSAVLGGMAIVPGMIVVLGSTTAGWLVGAPLSLASPLGAIGLAVLMGNEAQAWRAQAAWEEDEAEKNARRAETRAKRAAEKERERARAQREHERAEAVQREAEAAQARAAMSTDGRRAALLEEWRADPRASARKLARRYGVDASTIRRDLQVLEGLGTAWKENGEVKVISEEDSAG